MSKPKITPGSESDPAAGHAHKPHPPQDQIAEEARETQENEAARAAQASIRDRMVDIGRGHQQAGRQGE